METAASSLRGGGAGRREAGVDTGCDGGFSLE